MTTYSSSLTIIELEPNCGLKEIVVVTPTIANTTDEVQITLADWGLSTNVLAIDGFTQTTPGSVIVHDIGAELTGTSAKIVSGVLTISSVAGTGAKVFRILGRSS